MHHMVNTLVDFKEDLAPIFRILFATLLKKEPFSSSVKSYRHKQNLSWQKQENSQQ